MVTSFSRILIAIVIFPLILTAFPSSGSAQSSPLTSAEQLAEMYAPVAYTKVQPKECRTPPYDGEPYLPIPVDMILDNDQIVIRDREQNNEIVSTGPSAAELAGLGETTYMDFPGDPRQPGCTYERDERTWM